MRGLLKKPDHLIVGNIHDSRKDFLPFNLKPNYIKEVYSCKLLKLGNNGRFVSREFHGGQEDKTTKTEIWDMAQ